MQVTLVLRKPYINVIENRTFLARKAILVNQGIRTCQDEHLSYHLLKLLYKKWCVKPFFEE